MTPMRTHQIAHGTDPDGQRIVGVYVSNASRFAWLHEGDYRAVITRIENAAWFAHRANGYVYVRAVDPTTKRTITISRVILNADDRTGVRHSNGDRFDLRRRNLFVTFGGGGVTKRRNPFSSTLRQSAKALRRPEGRLALP